MSLSARRASLPRRVVPIVAGVGLIVVALVSCGGSATSSEPARIAFLRAVPGAQDSQIVLDVLAREGFVEGGTLEVFAADPAEAYPDPDGAVAAVAGWVEQGVDLIIAFSSSGAALALDAAPDAIVVFLVNDPVVIGLIENEMHPEGRATGVTFRVPADRTLSAARAALPGMRRVGLLYPATDPAAGSHRRAVHDAASVLRLRVVDQPFTTEGEIEGAIGRLVDEGIDALFLSNSPTAIRYASIVDDAAQSHRLPVIANTDRVPFALVVLTPDTTLLVEQLAKQVARLLNGTPPRAVPVEDPRRYQLILNAGAAAELGIDLPEELLRQATEVIP